MAPLYIFEIVSNRCEVASDIVVNPCESFECISFFKKKNNFEKKYTHAIHNDSQRFSKILAEVVAMLTEIVQASLC